jgi:hypothetical protein
LCLITFFRFCHLLFSLSLVHIHITFILMNPLRHNSLGVGNTNKTVTTLRNYYIPIRKQYERPMVTITKDELVALEESQRISNIVTSRDYGETAELVRDSLDALALKYKAMENFIESTKALIVKHDEQSNVDVQMEQTDFYDNLVQLIDEYNAVCDSYQKSPFFSNAGGGGNTVIRKNKE